jgi:3-oxoadipate enol-lactonase
MPETEQRPPLHWREAGPDSANVLLLVHGFPFSSAMWQPQLKAPPPGWRLIAPDLRGFGESPAPAAGPATLDSMADDLVAVLRHLRLRQVVVCGLSMGGYITFNFLRRYPRLVRALVLCDTRPEADTEEVRRGRMQSAARVTASGTSSVVDAMLPRVLAPATIQRAPDLAAEVRRIMETARPDGVIAALKAMAARPDSSPLLRSIHVPTQVVVGADDQITPAGDAQLMARGIPGSALAVIPDSGHLPNLENPEEFNRVLGEFLANLPAG